MATAELSGWRNWQNWRPFEHFKGDLTGGLTAALVALPLALAFAVASVVEPKAGLYTAIVAGTLASLFGGSSVQITGPTGAMAVVFIPYPVTAGFTNGIAVIIFCGQLNNFFGLELGRREHFIPALWDTLTHISALNWAAIAIASVVIFTKLCIAKNYNCNSRLISRFDFSYGDRFLF